MRMKRRLLSVVLAFVILIGLLPVTAVNATSVNTFTTSKEAVDVLKQWEGFLQYAKWDNNQYTIGYGTSCGKDEYPNGISKAQAEALLRQHLNVFEASVTAFADRNGLVLDQNKFDALVMFSFNVGTAWMTDNSSIREAVVQGKTGNEFIFCLARWCVSGGSVSRGHILRRLAEADIYLNGYYAKNAPDCFTYVLFNGNGGTYTYNVQGYDATQPVAVKGVAELEGSRFMGWYTAKEGGRWIDVLDSTTKTITLYARWQTGNGPVDAEGNVIGTEACYERIASAAVTVYAAPAVDADTVTSVAKDDTVVITADYLDTEGNKWGELEDGGWILLKNTKAVTVAAPAPDRSNSVTAGSTKDEEEEEEPFCVTVTVITDNVNFRSGPGTKHSKLGTLSKGKQLIITEVQEVDGKLWGKFSYGWVCLMYTDYDKVVNDTETETKVIAVGKVISKTELRIRSGAGTAYATIGALPSGAEVQIYEIVTNGNMKWGRIANGWISLTYVEYTMVEDKPTTPEPDDGQKPEDGGTAVTIRGWVTATSLNVRDKIGHGKVVARLPRDTYVTITRMVNYGGSYWGKIPQGWICMDYILIDNANSDYNPGDTPESGDGSGSGEQTNTVTGMVTASRLCVRSGPGTTYNIVSTLNNGATVTILQQKLVNGTVWGQIENGWISMTYVKVVSGGDMVISTGMITASTLCIRSAPGTGNGIVGTYNRGDVVEIYEIKQVNKTTWGRTAKGWICMDYVQDTVLPPTVPAPEQPGTGETPNPGEGENQPGETPNPGEDSGKVMGEVTASNLTVRKGPGTEYEVVGSLPRGTKIEILQQTLVNGVIWGQIENGWVCMTYVTITSVGDVVVCTGMVTATTLCIRSAAGTGNAIVGTYDRGDVVEIYEIKKVNKTIWGRTDKGWISMDYIQTTYVPDVEDKPSQGGVPSFAFTYNTFTDELNKALKELNVLAVAVTGTDANVKTFELIFTDSSTTTGVQLVMTLAEGTNLVKDITMVCSINDETACENLGLLSAFAMLLVDGTITEEDLDAMLNGEPVTDAQGNASFIMKRDAGTFLYKASETQLIFCIYPPEAK